MGGILAFVYGFVSYNIFFLTFLYLIAFVGNYGVDLGFYTITKTIDTGTPSGDGVMINLVLLLLFGFQHTAMARPGFKEMWTKVVPKSVERSTYVLITSLLLIVMFWLWRPMTDVVWSVSGVGAMILTVLYFAGWGIVLLSTFLINHFDLFGLLQVYDRMRGRQSPHGQFVTPLLYKLVRHPMMLGMLIAMWATPQMTVGHLFFASGMSLYILIGVRFEERDLAADLGPAYEDYQTKVPSIIPWIGGK